MNDPKQNERPEVYALHQDGGSCQVSRRDFLKTAGLGSAAAALSLTGRNVRTAFAEDSIRSICEKAPSHSEDINNILGSADGKYLVSVDSKGNVKSWVFDHTGLTGSAREKAFALAVTTGVVNGDSVILASDSSMFVYCKLPIDEDYYFHMIPATYNYYKVVTDNRDRFYGPANGKLHRFTLDPENKKSGQDEVLFELDSNLVVRSMKVIDNGSKLFIQFAERCGIFDIEKKTLKLFDGPCSACAVLPGEADVLIAGDEGEMKYRLVSLLTGETLWTRNLKTLEPDRGWPTTFSGITAAAVTPDGSYGLLLTRLNGRVLGEMKKYCYIELISLKDGSLVKMNMTDLPLLDQIVVSGDGTKCAAASGHAVLFFSLPDLEFAGCPVDLEEMKDNSEGILITGEDPATHETYTFTLPCGAPIPAGAVCTCNCVAGSRSSCSSHGTCGCHGHTYSYTYTYYYPN